MIEIADIRGPSSNLQNAVTQTCYVSAMGLMTGAAMTSFTARPTAKSTLRKKAESSAQKITRENWDFS